MTFPADGVTLNFLWVEEVACFQTIFCRFSLQIKVMDPCLILRYYPVEKNLWLGLQVTKKISANIDTILLLFIR